MTSTSDVFFGFLVILFYVYIVLFFYIWMYLLCLILNWFGFRKYLERNGVKLKTEKLTDSFQLCVDLVLIAYWTAFDIYHPIWLFRAVRWWLRNGWFESQLFGFIMILWCWLNSNGGYLLFGCFDSYGVFWWLTARLTSFRVLSKLWVFYSVRQPSKCDSLTGAFQALGILGAIPPLYDTFRILAQARGEVICSISF